MIHFLIWFLVAFFVVGTLTNGIGPKKIRESYAKWGYPSWFRYVTSALEFAVAVLLIFPETRLFGAGLGMMIMLAAAATLLRAKEYAHLAGPVVIFILTAIVFWDAGLAS
ncbi:hypothetical protein ROA7450_00616 [Roseovarius albus]|uniref:DoxX-like family protein n=1 Tax=Roseovarius albus TaxID=1247867 RepID=A0A1X6YET7_9RHOB|nr:DoxX family protein [Roseovarius albus]SLN19364.1 hypothetical protein ROA7450_00616 [Roseovarius albus]